MNPTVWIKKQARKLSLLVIFTVKLVVAMAVGLEFGTPGYVVNGIFDSAAMKPGLSRNVEIRDMLLTVPVYATGINGDSTKCTGTLVGRRYVLTSKRCIMISGLIKPQPRDWQEVPMRLGSSIQVVLYSPAAKGLDSLLNYGRSYKFGLQAGQVYKENAFFSDVLRGTPQATPVSMENYEILSVTNINFLKTKSDAVLLTLEREPQIVQQGDIDPVRAVEFGNYKGYADFIATNGDLKFILNGRSMSSLATNFYEVIGIGTYNQSSSRVTQQQKDRAFLSLRTSVPGISAFFKYSSKFQNSYCIEDCFLVSFINQGLDQGDTGAALTSTLPPGSYGANPNTKTIIGVVSERIVVPLHNQVTSSSGYTTAAVQGFDGNTIEEDPEEDTYDKIDVLDELDRLRKR